MAAQNLTLEPDWSVFDPKPPPPPEPRWEKWARLHWKTVKSRAAKKGLPFEITQASLVRMVKKCDGKCQLTGIPFSEKNPTKAFRRPWMPSVDRINNRKGYVRGNCRIVCVAVNQAMGQFGEDALYRIARALTAQ